MASRNLSDLTKEMEKKARQIVEMCSKRGVDLLVYCTLRSLTEQAKIYRSTRTRAQIDKKMDKLTKGGLGFLADIIESVGPQSGKTGEHKTFAGPGESWHNYAEAFDAVPMVGGKCAWKKDADNDGEIDDWWLVYGECVRTAGLNWAGDWKGFTELPHAQLRVGGSPLRVYKDGVRVGYKDPNEIKEILMKNNLIDSACKPIEV